METFGNYKNEKTDKQINFARQNLKEEIKTKLNENIPEDLKLAYAGVKGEINGAKNGIKETITGSIDLTKQVLKFITNKDYRDYIYEEIEIIYDFCEKQGFTGIKNIVIESIKTELENFEKLPKELQAENIGKISGNVIASLGLLKVGILAKQKLGEIINFDKLKLQEIFVLDDEKRLLAGEYFLKRKLNEADKKVILEAHNIGTPGENGRYTLVEIYEKYFFLKNNGFEEQEIKILMEKGVCGKLPEVKTKDIDLTDTLDQKGMYEISKIKGLKPIEAIKLIERFGDSIDINYLIDNPNRIRNMLDIIKNICYYIDNNIEILKKLDKQKFDDLKYGFNVLRRNIDLLENSNLGIEFEKRINITKNILIKNIYYKLHY